MNALIETCFEIEKKKVLGKQIATRCLEINSIGDEREEAAGKPCVFFNLAGHVGGIYIAVHEKGWHRDFRPDTTFHLGKYSRLSEFEQCLSYLDQILHQKFEAEKEKKGDEELSGETDRGEVFRSGRSFGRLLSNFMREEPKRT